MSREQVAALVFVAILVFWMVGAYNRLVALRSEIKRAWARVEEALKLRGPAASRLLAALQAPLFTERGALDAAQTALAEAARAAATMGSRPIVPAHATAWVAAEAGLAAAASRVFALLEQSSEDLRRREEVASGTARWREADSQLVFARQRFNEAAEAYDAAIALFPTSLLVPMFRFERAGRV